MLRSIQLENFKAFGQRAIIPLAPITLIFGQNSAGKSSILQSLSLLKQTRESRGTSTLLLPRAEAGYVDLGSFQEMVFDHELDRTICLRLEIPWIPPAPKSNGRSRVIFPPFKTMAVELGFQRASQEQDITLRTLQFYADEAHKPLAEFVETDVTQDVEHYAFEEYRSGSLALPNRLRAAQCVGITDHPGLYEGAHKLACKRRRYILRELKRARKKFREESSHPTLFDGDPEWQHGRRQSNDEIRNRYKALIADYSSEISLHDFIESRRTDWLTTKLGLDGFIPFTSWHSLSRKSLTELDVMSVSDSRFKIRVPRLNEATIGAIAIHAGSIFDATIRNLFPLGPFRRAPQRWYVFAGTTPDDVGYQGNSLPDLLYRKPLLIENTNEWLQKLDVGYRIQVQALGGRDKDLFEVRLIDTRRLKPVDVGLSDVGYGISQILPFIVQGLAGKNQIITIEQPEVHIHPRLQADLGDLLVGAIREPRTNQFIIETHSEHLILRLLRRIRETSEGDLPGGHPGLRPNDVSVIYLERGESGTRAHHLRIDESGEFIDRWPKGFFEERAKELF